jgi:putative ABC transport system permease protein
MLVQSFTILARRFRKDPVFSMATLLGLTLGFASFILLGQFINSMLSYDTHNENYERIYRVQFLMNQQENRVQHSASITAALSRQDLRGLPEIEEIALIHDVGDNNKNGIFLSTDKKTEFLTRWGYYADPSVFRIFTFNFAEGGPEQALSEPFTIVLSRSIADKLFKGTSALGKQIYLDNKFVCRVTGVYEDVPDKSTWEPSFLLPMESFAAITGWKNYEDNYQAYSFMTYVLLKKNADPAQVDAKIHDAMKEYNETHFPYLRPMSQLYLNPYFQPDFFIAIGLLVFNGLLILILSSINYVNLQTANASTRFREIGIKKTVGFSRRQLWYQFMTENLILAMISCMLGMVLVRYSSPFVNRLMGSETLSTDYHYSLLMIVVLLTALLTGVLSGIYPAYAISSFNPVKALKQKLIEEKQNGLSLRKVLVTAQFSIAIFLLIVGFVIYRQTHYMVNRNMGFDSKNVLFANIVTNKKGPINSLRQNLLSHPEIVDACHSDYIPFVLPGGAEVNWEGGFPDQKVFIRYSQVGYDFVPTFDLKMVEGRNFSRDYPGDYDKCLLNETAIQTFGWEEPVGMKLDIRGKTFTVIGVVKDYIVFSVHNPLEPHFYRLIPDTIRSNTIFSVRFKPGKERRAKEIVNQEFQSFFTDDAFEFRNIQSRIQNENAVIEWRHLMKINLLFAVLSIFVSAIGLFGLILFYTRNKLKEVGIRKVLGFTGGQLYYTLSSGFIKLLLISVVFAWPAAWYAYKSLPGANKYPIQLWEFLIATGIILLVALGTISYQIIKALRVNPAEIIKDE